jgi:hypothetical protein
MASRCSGGSDWSATVGELQALHAEPPPRALLDGAAPDTAGELVAGDPVEPADCVAPRRVEAVEAAQRGRECLG